MEIIYSDKYIVVCVKPRGVLSQDDGSEKCMPSLLKKEEKTDYIAAVHRLDKEVTGLMVYAKNNEAAAQLSRQMTDSTFKKRYTAIVCGTPEEKEGTYKDLLFHDSKKNKSYTVKRMRKGVRHAELNYSVQGGAEIDGNTVSLVNVELVTGRTHQIRVQFSSRTMPLLGDRKYGGGGDFPICLISTRLEFIHPKTKEKMCFEIKLPDENPWNILTNDK
ncbi:MAG: RluA family pseudouridine synthase [Clostridia bacterium]|nr:RluA family pseudouridine synthase [Clostridia bacterium]